jgi:predicted ABC-type transport system involved in lysophospholipase L1 biosynthesis ATPase subunit
MTAIIVTHDAAVSARVDRTIYIADGRIVAEPENGAPR